MLYSTVSQVTAKKIYPIQRVRLETNLRKNFDERLNDPLRSLLIVTTLAANFLKIWVGRRAKVLVNMVKVY